MDPKHRSLGSYDNNIFQDEYGNEYAPYSLAWRYLGMFIDCDYSDDGECYRTILWAMYVDLGYSGGTIGEYQFFDLNTGQWDDSTCKTERCAKMDCHEENTHYQLVNIYRENYGVEDWIEQLFKHQGSCLWNYQTYSFMQNVAENLPYECALLDTDDDYGLYLYRDLKPDPQGNFTYGFYSDSSCTKESSEYTPADYMEKSYNYYNEVIDIINQNMATYKICQPCKAYSLYNVNDDEYGQGNRRQLRQRRRRRRRKLEDGGNEQWGYDCYDDADYLNVNQCYKFASKTDMEEATEDDLKEASKQGTILQITLNGTKYGKGIPGRKAHSRIFQGLTPNIQNIQNYVVIVLLACCFYPVLLCTKKKCKKCLGFKSKKKKKDKLTKHQERRRKQQEKERQKQQRYYEKDEEDTESEHDDDDDEEQQQRQKHRKQEHGKKERGRSLPSYLNNKGKRSKSNDTQGSRLKRSIAAILQGSVGSPRKHKRDASQKLLNKKPRRESKTSSKKSKDKHQDSSSRGRSRKRNDKKNNKNNSRKDDRDKGDDYIPYYITLEEIQSAAHSVLVLGDATNYSEDQRRQTRNESKNKSRNNGSRSSKKTKVKENRK